MCVAVWLLSSLSVHLVFFIVLWKGLAATYAFFYFKAVFAAGLATSTGFSLMSATFKCHVQITHV